MKPIVIQHPSKVMFGDGSFQHMVDGLRASKWKQVAMIVWDSIPQDLLSKVKTNLEDAGIRVLVDTSIKKEPSYRDQRRLIEAIETFGADCVVGIGGGSVLDVAKLGAALAFREQSIEEVIGIGNLMGRKLGLVCVPTTAGTGSEVSPNAILLDESDMLKKGAVSPHLIPDQAYIDPLLTHSVPPAVTAATGIDALTHCLEAYTNKFAHPLVDVYAIKGVELIAKHIERAFRNGQDKDARAALALGSLYGGMCLGPINTAAVHALSYPLGGEFKVPHGISNAVILPYVMRFNVETVPDRYADIAVAIGAERGADDRETAKQGIAKLLEIYEAVGIPSGIRSFGVPESALDSLAESALKVTRLLKNNPRAMTLEDIRAIYREAY